ncbi:hypothetical protein L7F22_043697 [Adiantum nelumboides]|nr:hypothetical protein [Adiantum nelumboides]
MKFARYLEENVVVEWRKAYINYRGLKKLIKRVDQRYKARVSLELNKTSSHSSSLKTLSSAVDGLRRRQRRLSGASGEASDTPIWSPTDQSNTLEIGGQNNASSNTRRVEFEDDHEDRYPQVSLDGTGLRIDIVPTNPPAEQNVEQPHSSKHQQGFTEDTQKDSDESEEAGKAAGPDVDLEQGDEEHRRKMTSERSDQTIFDRIRHGMQPNGVGIEGNMTPKKRAKRAKRREKGEVHLSEVINSTFDDQEKLFFKALDSELERIVEFYVTRETDMAKRYEMIARQLEELADHRREYKATHQSAAEGWTDLSHRISHLVAPISQPAQTLKRASMQIRRNEVQSTDHVGSQDETQANTSKPDQLTTSVDEGDKRRASALSKMLNVYGGTLSETEDEELRKANRLAALSHDPERYKAARKKLKTAVLEYYRGLEILKNYKILNRTGFAKILKKFEKTTEVHCADAYYHSKVAPSVLVASETVEKLLKGTEEIYTAYFEHGNRKRALERLRIHTGTTSEQHSSTHHFSMARTGFYLGVAVCATVAGLVSAMHDDTPTKIPLWDQLMRVYGAEFLPTLFALLFGLNLAVWHHARVNAIFIFEWDVRHVLDFHQFFELPAFFLLLLSIAFWISFINPFPDSIAPTTWPLVWLVVVVVIMLNPLPIGYYHARKWLIVSLLRVFHGGTLSRVEFRDFFLGDELNSINWSISMLWFIGCQYNHKWAYPNQCDPNKTFWTAVLLAIPAFLRFVQCFRRWHDSRYTANLHLINAGKYTSSILNYFFYLNYRYHGSSRKEDLIVWCIFGTIYSIYTSSWDITMDWSLLQPRARYPFLRNELVYEQYWPFYYWAMITNVILRFGWTIYLMGGPAGSLTRIFIIAFLEMLRRWQWNFLRLENEHLGNVDMYRVSREVPLPYHVRSKDAQTDEEDEEGESSNRFKRFAPKSMMKLVHSKNVKAKEEWRSNGYPPSNLNAGSSSSSPSPPHIDRQTSTRSDKGKQPIQSSAEESDGSETANGDTLVSKKGRMGSSSLAVRIRDSLVPDRGGMEKKGETISGMAAAHGSLARDYEPRKIDGSSLASDDSDLDGEEEDDKAGDRSK